MEKFTKLFIIFIFLSFAISTHAQSLTLKQQQTVNKLFKKKTEVYFKFNINSRNEINVLTKIISIDNVKNNVVYAYANQDEFTKFLLLNYPYTVLPNPNTLQKVKMEKTSSLKGMQLNSWSTYPTYTSYETIMSQFVTNYPSICKLVNIGTLASGRKLLVLKISDNINVKEDEPEFLYTSSMHGDEVAGYVGMLNYIDYLLSNYGTNTRVTNLVNSMEIWICPLANPDGTYKGGNSTVNGAIRYNANNVDLNRNYPDPAAGQHPDGKAWQPETQAFMGFADTMNFVMSANFHGGSEVVNYPWDTWAALTADNNWWVRESKKYADTAQANSPAGYFTSVTSTGYINGYAWYTITGGRQDYMNYFKHCREVTIELSNTKILPAASLTSNYNYNIRSWLNYMEEALHGIRGIVTDSCSGQPLRAKVFISGHDHDSSEVYSALPVGDYHRPIYQGTYNVTYSAPGYQSKTVNGITVTNGNATVVNVLLKPIVTPTVTSTISSSTTVICQGDAATFNASVVNGGSTPVYQWKVNGVNAGTNSPTFSSSTLNNGNVVTCVINSSNICAFGNPATSNSVTITVNALPTVTVTASSSTVCAGSTVTLSGGGATSYAWSGGVTNGIGFVPTSTNTYTVTGTNGNGCTNTATKTITVNALPTVTVTASSSTVCAGSTVTLTAGGATSYAWSGGVTNGIGFVPTSTNTYTVTGTNGNGCTNTATKTITVNPLPIANAGSNYTICPFGSVSITATGNGTFAWSPSTGLNNASISNPVANPSVTTTYTLAVTNSCGTATSVMTITTGSTPSINAGNNAAICPGGNTTLNASGSNGTYAWSPSSSLSNSTISNPIANPTITTIYTATLTASCGTATGSVVVTVNAKPTITISGNTSICSGNSISLNASGGTSYVWAPGGQSTSGIVDSPSTSTTYTVTGTNTSGCTNTASTTLTIMPAITNSITIAIPTCGNNNGTTTAIAAGGSGNYNYLWNTTPAQTTVAATGLTGQPTQTLIVTISDAVGCVLNDTAIVNCVTGIDQFEASDSQFTVFPNPSNGIFTVEVSSGNNQYRIEIYNLFGEKTYQNITANQKSVIDISCQPSGVYFLKIINQDGSSAVKKIIRE